MRCDTPYYWPSSYIQNTHCNHTHIYYKYGLIKEKWDSHYWTHILGQAHVWLEMAGVVLESKSGPCLTELSQELKLGRLEDWMYDIFFLIRLYLYVSISIQYITHDRFQSVHGRRRRQQQCQSIHRQDAKCTPCWSIFLPWFHIKSQL